MSSVSIMQPMYDRWEEIRQERIANMKAEREAMLDKARKEPRRSDRLAPPRYDLRKRPAKKNDDGKGEQKKKNDAKK